MPSRFGEPGAFLPQGEREIIEIARSGEELIMVEERARSGGPPICVGRPSWAGWASTPKHYHVSPAAGRAMSVDAVILSAAKSLP